MRQEEVGEDSIRPVGGAGAFVALAKVGTSPIAIPKSKFRNRKSKINSFRPLTDSRDWHHCGVARSG
jgi:hypothetical protein